MEKFTIGIPTIWKSQRINKSVKDLNELEIINEIIIIDNLHQYDGRFDTIEKVRVIQPEENLWVNPAWNRIVKEAQSELIVLLNDDINFDVNIFNVITKDTLEVSGFIGMGQGNYENTEFDSPPIIQDATRTSDGGWGCMIMFPKHYWVDIPEKLKIWYGDNFIKERNPYPKSVLRNFPIETEMSTSSDLMEVRAVRDNDSQLWSRGTF